MERKPAEGHMQPDAEREKATATITSSLANKIASSYIHSITSNSWFLTHYVAALPVSFLYM